MIWIITHIFEWIISIWPIIEYSLFKCWLYITAFLNNQINYVSKLHWFQKIISFLCQTLFHCSFSHLLILEPRKYLEYIFCWWNQYFNQKLVNLNCHFLIDHLSENILDTTFIFIGCLPHTKKTLHIFLFFFPVRDISLW